MRARTAGRRLHLTRQQCDRPPFALLQLVADGSEPARLAQAAVDCWALLDEPHLAQKPVILLLNKECAAVAEQAVATMAGVASARRLAAAGGSSVIGALRRTSCNCAVRLAERDGSPGLSMRLSCRLFPCMMQRRLWHCYGRRRHQVPAAQRFGTRSGRHGAPDGAPRVGVDWQRHRHL
jgi:hypothetical protein